MREIQFKGNTYRITYEGKSEDWQKFRTSLILALRSMSEGQILTEHKGMRVRFYR